MNRFLAALGACLFLAACGGGGGGGTATTTTTPTPVTPVTPALSNFATVTVDAGPPALQVGANGYTSDDLAFVSVTLCAPGTSNCQTIDHVQVDTGSTGLRIVRSVLNASLLAALPTETDAAANPVGECYGFVDGYVFGSVRTADFQIGGESVAGMPLQVIGDTGVFSTVPTTCSSGGGTQMNTVQTVGANGILGIGVGTTDCGSACTVASGYSAAAYYDCPSSGCSGGVARANSTSAPFQQLPNPVAAMSVDNNGVIMELPAAAGVEASLSGTLYFGIGTQTNNGLGSATVLTASSTSSPDGGGFVSVNYKGQTLPNSFIDSGSTLYLFVDSAIAACTQTNFIGYYCPASPLTLSPTITGLNGVSAVASFTLNDAESELANNGAVLPGIGGNPDLFSSFMDVSDSFDFGLPFFYGRNIYLAFDGRTAGGVAGPFYAF